MQHPSPRTTPFALTGTLTAVDPATSSIGVLVKGGRDARGSGVTVAVASGAKINLDDRPATLAALSLGSHVAVSGTVAGGVRTALRVNVND